MKKILILSLSLLLTYNCSSSDDEPTVQYPVETNVIPSKYKGSWRVDYYTSQNGNWNSSTPGAFHIKFNNDNSIEVKNINGTFSGPSKNSEENFIVQLQNDSKIIISASNSDTHAGYTTFIIRHENSPSNYETRLYDAKKL